MIYTIAAVNPKGEVINMHLSQPQVTGLNVKNVTGISPIGAEIYSTPFASIDGAVYAGSRVPSRNIVLTIGMWPEEIITRIPIKDENDKNPNKDPNFDFGELEDDTATGDKGDEEAEEKPKEKIVVTYGSIEESRLKTYNFFQIKDEVELIFITDHRALGIKGYVESNEVEIFSDHEEAVISVICVNPWFYTANNPKVGYFGTTAGFEFPFESEVYGETIPELFEFGDISIDTRFSINYKGDIKTGVKMHITFSDSKFHNIYVYNMVTRERFTIYTEQITKLTEHELNTGDEIQICTVSGNKYAYLIRDGVFINILSAIDKNSDWLQLTKGNNIFAFMSDYGYEHVSINVTYQDMFAGI